MTVGGNYAHLSVVHTRLLNMGCFEVLKQGF